MGECALKLESSKTPEESSRTTRTWGSLHGILPSPCCNKDCSCALCKKVQDISTRYPISKTMVVPGSLTIEKCTTMMKQYGMTSVLISESMGKIDGIFTDRDLFIKMNQCVADEKFWSTTVRVMMTSPAVTVTPELVYLVPELMVKHNIRHVPIVESVGRNRICVLGTLNMESMFIGNVKAQMEWKRFVDCQNSLTSVGVLSKDRMLSSRITETLSQAGNILVKPIYSSEIMSDEMISDLSDSMNNFIIDLDGGDFRKTVKLINTLKVNRLIEHIILLFSPERFPSLSLEMLKGLAAKPISFVTKPIEIRELVNQLTV